MQKIILALAGEMGSGKGAIAEYLIAKHGAVKFRFSSVFRDILDRLHIEESRENIQALSTALRSAFGDDILSQTIVGDIGRSEESLIILDGVRREEDMRYLRHLEGFVFIFVDAGMDVRYTRVVSRGENASDTTKTLAQFLKEGEAETETRIRGLREIADRVIVNDKSMEELYETIEQILAEIKHG